MDLLLSIRNIGFAYFSCIVSYCALLSGDVHSRRAKVQTVTTDTNPADEAATCRC